MGESISLMQKRLEARAKDIEFLEKIVRDNIFNWDERYNHKYLLDRAKDIVMNASRLQKAVETLDSRKRKIKNKLQRFQDNRS